MPLEVYTDMGKVHTSDDEVIDENRLSKLQKELNDHVKMIQRIYNVGATHGDKNVERVRNGFTTGANNVPVL